MLYDYSSENSFSIEVASVLSSVFFAQDWQEHIEIPKPQWPIDSQIEIDSDVETAISDFLKTKNSGVLILESMDSRDRDNWVEYILSQSKNSKYLKLKPDSFGQNWKESDGKNA